MAPKRHRDLFEELGLLDQAPAPNPFQILGLDPSLVQDLLREGKDGTATIKFAAKALYGVLAKRYHPDVERTGNADRFREIADANTRVEKAEPNTLARWAKVDQASASSSQSERKLTAEHAAFANRMAEMFQTGLELGSDPNHFSQIAWSQGVLLQRAGMPLLLRTDMEGRSNITRGEAIGGESEAFGLSGFLLKHRSFGLEPGADIRAYIDEAGRASLLTSDLEFVMDITDPVDKYRRQQESLRMVHNFSDDSDLWLRAREPILLTTKVPLRNRRSLMPGTTQALIFRSGTEANPLAWTLPLQVAGTAHNADFFRRMRHSRTSLALEGGRRTGMNYFQLAAIPASEFIRQDAQYSPLMKDGSLVLYDSEHSSPIVTDAKVIGMLGTHSGAA